MRALKYNEEAFMKLQNCKFATRVSHMEGEFCLTGDIKNPRIIKTYLDNSYNNIHNKIKTVCALDKNKKIINIPELVVPDRVVLVDDKFKGFASPYIKSENVNLLLKGKDVPNNIKIKILIQIGEILKKISMHQKDLNLAYGDVHPGNFIYDGNTTYAIDTDGMKIKDNIAYASPYLLLNPNVKSVDKYETNEFGVYMASYNGDIFSFVMMILEVISDGQIYTISLEEYKNYLDYLEKLGFDPQLLSCFEVIYDSNKTNINPVCYLDTIKEIDSKATIKAFRKRL